MAPSAPIVVALFRLSSANLDEQSMLQMPVVAKNVETDASDCACPGYFEEQCRENAFQGCIWSSDNLGHHSLGWTDEGNSNAPWCQCDPDFQGTPPLYTSPDAPAPPVDPPPAAPDTPAGPPPAVAPVSCPGDWTRVGELGADIGGCGLQACNERYEPETNTPQGCADACASMQECVAFSFAPLEGDRNHGDQTVCTLYDNAAPTGRWPGTDGSFTQVFCTPPLPGQDDTPEVPAPSPPPAPPAEWIVIAEDGAVSGNNCGSDTTRMLDFPNACTGGAPYHIRIESQSGDEWVEFKTDTCIFSASFMDMNLDIYEVTSSESSIDDNAQFCKACSSGGERWGDTCWGVVTSDHRSCGCNSGGWAGSGMYYGGYSDATHCSSWPGSFSGMRNSGQQKGSICSNGVRIMIHTDPSLLQVPLPPPPAEWVLITEDPTAVGSNNCGSDATRILDFPDACSGGAPYEILVETQSGDQWVQFKTDTCVFGGSFMDMNVDIYDVSSSDASIDDSAQFCKACNSGGERWGDTCWGVVTSSHRSCGCNSGGWAGSGMYYGGYSDATRCASWPGSFSGMRTSGQQKGRICENGVKIYVKQHPVPVVVAPAEWRLIAEDAPGSGNNCGSDSTRILDFPDACSAGAPYRILVESHNGDEWVEFKTDTCIFDGSFMDMNIDIYDVTSSDGSIDDNAEFCKACSSGGTRWGDTCWGVVTSDHRSCGCNSGGWTGSGMYYGGYSGADRCASWPGSFSGMRNNGQQKGSICTNGVKIYVHQ